jgi:hypothetical protein
MLSHENIRILRECLSVLTDASPQSYDPNILYSSLLENCTTLTLELARVKTLAGHPNNAEIDRFLTTLARQDEGYIREAEDFEMKCGTLAADVSRLLNAAGRNTEAGKFSLISSELNKRFTVKSYLIDTLFSEVLAIINRSTSSLRSPENSDFFFSGWAAIKFPDSADFTLLLVELRPKELRVIKDEKLVKKFLLSNVNLSVALAPERELSVEPLLKLREASTGPGLEVWTKAVARALQD